MRTEAAVLADKDVDFGMARVPLDPELQSLTETIAEKMAKTQAWVEKTYGPGYHALFLNNARAWQGFPQEAQAVGGRAMATILAATYPPNGQGYPLPDRIEADANQQAIASGAILPYFGFIAPRDLTQEAVYDNPGLLVEREQELVPAAVSARVIEADGSDELGRSAKMPGLGGFRAGALVLQSYVDARRDGVNVVRADVRAASEHKASGGKGKVASSGATQELYMDEIGMSPIAYVHAYEVGGQLEPFVMGQRHSNDAWQLLAEAYTVYTPPGDHVAFLQALTRHQIGSPAPITVVPDRGQPYKYVKPPQFNGDKIYAKIVVDPSAETSLDAAQLMSAINDMDQSAPVTIAKVPVHTLEGADTQAALINEGFVPCGYEPAHEKQGRVVPPVMYLARLGGSAVYGSVSIAPTYLPDNLYGRDLRKHFQRIDSKLKDRVPK